MSAAWSTSPCTITLAPSGGSGESHACSAAMTVAAGSRASAPPPQPCPRITERVGTVIVLIGADAARDLPRDRTLLGRAGEVPCWGRACCSWPCRPTSSRRWFHRLILFTCLLVGVSPALNRRLRERRGPDFVPRESASPVTTFFPAVTGVYGGYFGAGSGVMMMAVLGLGTGLEFRIVNALKTLAVVASNVVATVIFLFVAELDWRAIVLLAAGSVVGGYVGARVGRRLPPTLLRTAVVITGVVAAGLMIF